MTDQFIIYNYTKERELKAQEEGLKIFEELNIKVIKWY